MARQVIRRHGELEIDEDPPVENATWIVERIAWAVLAVVVVAAFFGAFGRGPLSRAQASASNGALVVDYPRVTRLDAPESIELRFRTTGSGPVAVELGGDLARDFLLLRVQPEPRAQRPRRDGMDMEFEGTPDREHVAVIHLRSRRPAFPARATVGLRGAPPVEISTFVLP